MEALRALIVSKFVEGMKPCEIFRSLKSVGIRRDFIYKTIKRFKDTSSVKDRKKGGRPRSVRSKERIEVVREQIRRKKGRSIRKLAGRLGISKSSTHLILKKDLGLKANKKHKVPEVSSSSRQKRAVRVDGILAWHAGDELVFSDEKLFVLEKPLNPQSDRVWAVRMEDVPGNEHYVPRYQNASLVPVHPRYQNASSGLGRIMQTRQTSPCVY